MTTLKATTVKKLSYLLTVGYSNNVIVSFTEYCKDEQFDEDSLKDDLEDIADSSIVEHLQDLYQWNDQQRNHFYRNLRQALDIDTKAPQNQQTNVKDTDKEPKEKQIPKQILKQIPKQKLFISADHIDYNLSPEELKQHKEIYLEQCPRLIPLDEQSEDKTLLKVLAIGRKNNTPLLQNIADTYSRFRINQYLEDNRSDLRTDQFSSKYEYFRKLKRNNDGNFLCLSSALESFHRRICPRIQFQSLLCIDDSLSDYFEYVASTIQFVHTIVKTQQCLPPFQVDFWLIPKNVKSQMTYETTVFSNICEEDSDDDSDDEEDPNEYEDEVVNTKLAEEKIGDIESRLRHEKCLYDADYVQFNSPSKKAEKRRFGRELDVKCKAFWKRKQEELREQHNQQYHQQYVDSDETGAHKTRICIVVDRRKPKETDKPQISGNDSSSSSSSASASASKSGKSSPKKKTWDDKMYIYSPPTNCNTISDGYVPESYFNSSKECILPGKGYNNGKREIYQPYDEKLKPPKMSSNGYHHDDTDQKYLDEEDDIKDIAVGDPVGGYQFTLSFHVQAIDDIKCYIFYNGWISRFFPQDMIEIWPSWFAQTKENTEFVKKKKWKKRMNQLQDMLCDDQFSQWYKDTTGLNHELLKKY